MDLVFFKEMMKRETDILVNSVLAIGKEGDWNSITSLLLSFQALVNKSTQDFLSLVPQDIYRIIFDFCTPKDQISLSRTCKRLHSMKWMEPIWKEESIKQYKQLVPLSVRFFEVAIEYIGIPWANVLECFLRPKKMGNSFRRYHSLWSITRIDSFTNDDKQRTDTFVLGKIDDDRERIETGDLIEYSKRAVVVKEGRIKYHTYIGYHEFTYKNYFGDYENDVIYFGKCNGQKEEFDGKVYELYDGIMVWSDGFSYSGVWTAIFDYNIRGFVPEEKIIHPKIQECLENETCTRFSGVNGPQMVHGNDAYCQYCVVNCRQFQKPDYYWTCKAECQCDCQQKQSKKRRIE
eukprot:TRINITY_DN1183_c0_g5_i2.p1 TRINITY_DN1183_c0_g5~~TRINITY_DN1183_c0_g5_i2.p1  ORF type:complete len:347 (+),score=47.11 TRINITY_DN1183_c0_g5_i2:33-1073(+)